MGDSTPFRNIAIVGASGRLGPFILSALLDAGFNITVITRVVSWATFPSNVKIVRVEGDYPAAQMAAAFKNQDAVVLSLGMAGEHHHAALVRAALKANVKRVVVSGYGCYEGNEKAQRVFRTAKKKADMLEDMREVEKLASKEGKNFTWTNICCGLFFDFCIEKGFFGIDPNKKTATIWDDGKQPFSCSTRETIGKAVARILQHPERTANRSVYVSSFETCLNDILAAEQKATKTKAADWSITKVKTEEQIAKWTKEMHEATEFMPRMVANGRLALAVNLKPDFQQDFRKMGVLDNEWLGIEPEKVDDVVKRVLAKGPSSA